MPEKYELKLADGVTADPALLEKTAATARTLGLSQEQAQSLLDFTAAEAKAHADAMLASFKPGGAEYTKQEQGWAAAAKADPELAPTPQAFKENVELAKKVLGTFGSQEVTTFLHESGFGSHPAVLKMLSAIGRSMSEGAFVMPSAAADAGQPRSGADVLYGGTSKQKTTE